MCYVTFSTPLAPDSIVRVYSHKLLEPCIEFALALHRSANEPHSIGVFRDDDCRLTLVLEGNPSKEEK